MKIIEQITWPIRKWIYQRRVGKIYKVLDSTGDCMLCLIGNFEREEVFYKDRFPVYNVLVLYGNEVGKIMEFPFRKQTVIQVMT